jgi:anti-anti-sigma factor
MPLQLSTRNKGGAVIVDCSGRLVHGEETSALREMVGKLITQHRQIVLNFADVTYMDSSGLGLLVSLHASAQKAGAVIKLAALNANIEDLLQLTRVAMVLEIAKSADEAAASFAVATALP